MPDISMCTGEGCPRADQCYRKTARPDKYLQSYFAEPPFDKSRIVKDCLYFMAIWKKSGRTGESS